LPPLAGSSATVAVTAPLMVRLPAVEPTAVAVALGGTDVEAETAPLVPAAGVDPAAEWLFVLLQAVATTLIARTAMTVRFMRRC
jgi:hypothetical protein